MAESRSVVVTGASSGIGWATSKFLVERGWRVFGAVRKAADAERLRSQFGGNFHPLLFDVTDHPAVHQAALEVAAALEGRRLAGLVNNAGIAVSGPLLYLPVEEFRRQLEVNLTAPLVAVQAFSPLLGSDSARTGKPGRVVNISSVAGRLGMPFLGPYAASKHALEGLSESLRRELLLHGIDVIVVAPGAVVTPIWDKAEGADTGWMREYAESVAKFAKYAIETGRKGLPAERIAETVYRALTARRPRVRYTVVPGRLKNWVLPRLLPARALDRLIAKQLGWSFKPAA